MQATPELPPQPLSLQDRGETGTLDLSTPEGVKQFKDGFIANAAKGRDLDRLQYFQDLLILDASGVLEQDPNLQGAVIQSGQDPLIWQGIYEGVKNSAEVLQNPDASPQQRQIARQNLQAYFRITEITQMNTPPNYQDSDVQAKVSQVWEATWNGLNSWRPLLQEVTPGESAPAAGLDATLSKNAGIEENVQFTLTTENRAAVEEIFDELRNELRAKKDRVYSTWAVMHSKSAHQKALSTLLNLDANINAAALERAQTRLEIARECDLSDGATLVTLVKNQPELLQRLFAQASPEIQQAFTQFQDDSDAFRFKRNLTILIEQASGVTNENLDTESDLITQAYNQTKEFNKLLLEESQPPIEELIQAFITLNQMRIALGLHQSKLASARSSYYGILAAKAGLKIEKGDYNNPVLLDLAEEKEARISEEITREIPTALVAAEPALAPPGTEPAIGQPAAPDLTSPESKDAHTLFAELQQVAKKRPPDEAYDPERARIRDMRKDQLQLTLSAILGLSEDRSYISEAEVLGLWQKMWSYFTGNDRQLFDLLSPQQIQLAGELFAQGPPDLQEAFKQFQDGGKDRNLTNLQDLIKRLATETYISEEKRAEDTRGRKYMTFDERLEYEYLFWDLLAKEPPPSDDELTQAFIKKNQALRDQMELRELKLRGTHQFITDLAQKAGLEIVKTGSWGFELVRKNTPPPQELPASA